MNNVKVSVVLPFYGVEEFIGECLESIVTQSLQEIEVICIDDASLDGSRDIVLGYMNQDDRIRLITNKKNCGVSVSRNRGLENSVGEYVYVMDSDDILCANALKQLYEKAKEKNADIVMADAYKYFKDGTKKYVYNPHIYTPLRYWRGEAAWWFIFKRRLIVEHEDVRFPPNVHPYEDTLFSFMLFSFTKKAVFVRAPILYYRQHADMCMRQLDNDKRNQIMNSRSFCYEALDQFVKKHKAITVIRRYAYTSLLLHLTCKCSEFGVDRIRLPHRLSRMIRFHLVKLFFLQAKITKSGKFIVKVCKIPVIYIRLKEFQGA